MTSSTIPASYEVDGFTPDQVVSPGSVEELSSALADAHSAGQAVIPFGGSTRMAIGNVPERYTTAIDLTSLSNDVVHEAGDLTLVADAGARISDIQSVLATSGQRLPFDVRSPESATLGGSVASNAAGQMSSSFGGIRDWVIGMKVVLADGTVTKSGGKVVKNVQGYDLHRLHTGAFGTLGVIAEVALKVVPIPAECSTVATWFESVSDAAEYAIQIVNGPVVPEAFSVFTGVKGGADNRSMQTSAAESSVLVLATVSGGQRAVLRMENDLTGLAGALGASSYDVAKGEHSEAPWKSVMTSAGAHEVTARITLKPRDAFRFLEKANASNLGDGTIGELQAGFGSVTISPGSADLQSTERIKGMAAEFGRQVVIERCPIEIKKQIDVFGDSGTDVAVMRSIKQRFDPQRILNPGRFKGRI